MSLTYFTSVAQAQSAPSHVDFAIKPSSLLVDPSLLLLSFLIKKTC